MIAKRHLLFIPLIGAIVLLLTASAGKVSAGEDKADPRLTPKQQLGKSIFFDEQLSLKQNQACAACHGPTVGWTGPSEEFNKLGGVYEGSVAGRFGARKPPAAGYAALSPVFHFMIEDGEKVFVGGNFWDGRATGEKLGNPAADQAQGPFLNPVEQALPDSACVVYRVCNPAHPADYPVKMSDVFGSNSCQIRWPKNVEKTCAQEGSPVALAAPERAKANAAYDQIALAIAGYEASPAVNAFTAKYDYYLAGKVKLTKPERQGLELFAGQAQCAACHTLTPGFSGEPVFTDFTYDNVGIPKNPANPVYKVAPAFVDNGLGEFLAKRAEYAPYAAENYGKHKVPTLRNIDLRPSSRFVKAYMHNGYFKTLEGVVHFYNTRDALPTCAGDFTEAQALANHCWPAPEVAANLNTTEIGNLHLSAAQEKSLIAFLRTLNDGFIPTQADMVSATDESTSSATENWNTETLAGENSAVENLDDSANQNYHLFLPITTSSAP